MEPDFDEQDFYEQQADFYEQSWGAQERPRPAQRSGGQERSTGVGLEYGIPADVRRAAVEAFRNEAMLGYRDAAASVSRGAAARGMATSGQVAAQQGRLRGQMVDRPTGMYRTSMDLESAKMASGQRFQERMEGRRLESAETSGRWAAGTSAMSLLAAIALKFALQPSDERLKTNIRKTAGRYSGLGLQTYSWDWNGTARRVFNLEGGSTGVLAQEVQKKYPIAVSDREGYLAVNYYELDKMLAARTA